MTGSSMETSDLVSTVRHTAIYALIQHTCRWHWTQISPVDVDLVYMCERGNDTRIGAEELR